jgi:hypothetical protein
MTQELETRNSLKEKSLDELATELALLPEGSEEVDRYHAELVRRENQSRLDASTAQLASEKRRYSPWTIVILAIAILAMAASIMFQK